MAQQVYGHAIDPAGNVIGRISDLKGAAGGGLISLRVDAREIEELGGLLAQAAEVEPAAVALALTRTAQETRTAVARALVTQTGLKYGDVRSALSVMNATAGYLSAAIVATGSFVPLAQFGARQTSSGVSAAPWAHRRIFAHTFMIGSYGGNVYKRVTNKRFPLHKLYGPAIPRELPKDQSAEAFWATVPMALAKRLDHELGRLLAR